MRGDPTASRRRLSYVADGRPAGAVAAGLVEHQPGSPQISPESVLVRESQAGPAQHPK